MITQQEQEKVDQTHNRLEEMKKSVKTFQKYLVDNCQEVEYHNKKIFFISQQYYRQINYIKDDPINLAQNVSETISMFDYSAKIITQQQTDFQLFYTHAFDDYFEKQAAQSKRINDLNQNNLKQMLSARQNYQKARSKYEKLCKEVEMSLINQKKNSDEAKSGYNVELASKTEIRIKDTYKQIQVAEQVYRDQTEAVQVKTKEFQDGLMESQIHLKQVFKYSNEKLIEITMKQDQHNLLSFNWIKGHIDDKHDKMINYTKLESSQEDLLIQAKIDETQQDLVMKQTNIKYIDIMARLLGTQQATIQDLEYNMYPDVLSKFIDTQMSFIGDRIKNMRTLSNFINELAQNQDLMQKQIGKIVKTSTQQLQDMQMTSEWSLYGKKLLQIQETFSVFHEIFGKKIYQLCQFLQMKQQTIENLIKDQKAQEKSFLNMYSKMHKDITVIKNQIQVSLFDGGDNKQSPQQKDALMNQLKKMVKEGAPILYYSLDQIRGVENQRAQQVSNIIEGMVQQYNHFIDETIKNTKIQEESLNKRYDVIEQEINSLPAFTLPTDVPEFTFTQNLQVAEELKLHNELSNAIEDQQPQQQQQDEDDDRNLEEGAVKVGIKLLEKFKVSESEKCLASYACAFDNKILLQGRLYVFSSKVCFHSYFNAKTLFGTTVLVIPPSDVQSIRKAKAYLFDNAIEFQTKKGVLTFTSFINRDNTIMQMKQLKGFADGVFEVTDEKVIHQPDEILTKSEYIQEFLVQESPQKSQDTPQKSQDTAQKSQDLPQISDQVVEVIQQKLIVEVTQQKQTGELVQLKIVTSEDEIQKAQVLKDAQPEIHQAPIKEESNILFLDIMVNKKDERIMNATNLTKWSTDYPISVQNLTELLFVNKPYTSIDGKQYQNFFSFFMSNVQKDKDIKMQPFTPEPEWGQASKRTVSFIHPVREKVMFAPESVTVSSNDTIYLFNKNEVLFEKELSFSKIPYGDHFKCRVYYHLKTKAGGCTLNHGFYVHFVKSTVWKGKIEASSKSENTEVWEKFQRDLILKEVLRFNSQQKSSTVVRADEVQDPQVLQEILKDILNEIPREVAHIEQGQPIQENQPLLFQQLQQIPGVWQEESVQAIQKQDPILVDLGRRIDRQTFLLQILIGLVVVDFLLRLLK